MTAEALDARLLDALRPELWARANRELLAKLLTELMFEEVLAPQVLAVEDGGDPARLAIAMPDGRELRCSARWRALGYWRVLPGSLEWRVDGAAVELPDVDVLVAGTAPALGAGASTVAGIVGELASTLVSDTVQLAEGRPVAELLDLDPLRLDGELRGHPWIVASKGRVGFDAHDLLRHAPEARTATRLPWVAAGPELAEARCVPGLTHADAVREQVGDETWAAFRATAAGAGLDPDTAVYLPVHPWQWRSRVALLWAGALARRRLVPLGEAPQRYLAHQSIRTLGDVDDPGRRYLKLALSILNTSVYRGIPRARALVAPELTVWFQERCAGDPFLRESGLVLLGEVASATVAHPALEAIPEVPYQHTEALGAIWREPLAAYLRPGERAVPLAALMHRDPSGGSFAAALVERSGLAVDDWVERLHAATLPPLLHVLYRFGAAFSPHGQNCALVLRGDVPERLAVRDFVDDATVTCDPLPELRDFPAAVRAALGGGVESTILPQWVQCGLLVCVHRYLADALEDVLGYPEDAFWSAGRRVVRAYQERCQDELGGRYDLLDVDAPVFVKLCLNRVRLFGRGYADGATRPIAAASGVVRNPLALEVPA